jgi:outer membrane protein
MPQFINSFLKTSPLRLGILVGLLIAHTAWSQPTTCPAVQPQSLNLSAAARRALCLNPSSLKAAANLRQSQAGLAQSQAAQAPVWTASAGPSASWNRADGRNNNTASAAASVGLSYTLSDGGLRKARIAQSEQELNNSAQLQALTQQDALLDFVGRWADARDAQAALQAVVADVASAQASEAAARARFDAGSATRVDVLTAQSALAQSQRDELAARTKLRKVMGVLAQYLDLDPQQEITLTGNDLLAIDASSLNTSGTPQALTENLKLNHPKMKAQQALTDSAKAALDASRAQAKPQLSLSASAGPTWSRSNVANSSYSSATQWSGQTGLNWTMTFSDGGSRDAAIASSIAQLDAAQATYLENERTLSTTLWQSYADWRDADNTVIASNAALDAATAAEAAQRGRYSAGLGTINDVLSAKTQLAQSRQQLSTAQQQRLRAQAALLHALGQLHLYPNHAQP